MRLRASWLFATLIGNACAGLPAAPALLSRPPASARAGERRPLFGNGARHFLASALSGAAGVTALAPVEVVRLSLMTNKDLTFKSAVALLGRSPAAWFRGNSADTLATALKVGITMPAFALYKRWLTSAAVRWGDLPGDAPSPRWAIFLAGALAGCTATVITFPLDVARTRIALECSVDMTVATCLAGIGQTEGLGALYRGLGATVLGILPFSSIKLASYDELRRRATAGLDDPSASLPLGQSARYGAVAGVIAATSCFPLEVVRRRQMAGEFAALSAVGALRALLAAEGTGALFRGVRLNIFKVGTANSIGFAFYEGFKDALAVDGRTPQWRRAARRPPQTQK